MFSVFLIGTYFVSVDRKPFRNLWIIPIVAFIAFSWWYVLGLLNFGAEFYRWFILNPSENRLDSPFSNFSIDYFIFVARDLGLWLLVPVLYFATKLGLMLFSAKE